MELLTVSAISALLTLTALEIVLGIDNIVFIAIVTAKLPPRQRPIARKIGLALAAAGRLILLLAITWLIMLEHVKLPAVFGYTMSVKDLILLLGGLFLVAKATWEIHHNLEGAAQGGSAHVDDPQPGEGKVSFGGVIGQILMLDVVFSIDSVLTAVGMVNPSQYAGQAPFPGTDIPWTPVVIMAAAILIAIAVMLLFVNPVGQFVERHPTIKMLALSFLVLIGVVLVAEAFHQHIPRGYIYSAMGFSLVVELLNLRFAKKPAPRKPAQP